MAEAEADLPCRFRWHILNFSVPFSSLDATFYSESPAQMHQWQATFMSQGRQISRWPFSFLLWNFKFGERDDVVVADQVRVRVSVDGREMERKQVSNYSFSEANGYTFQFLGNLIVPSVEGSHNVTIEVQLSFPYQNVVDQTDHPAARLEDLVQLSEDMNRLLVHPQYSNLILLSPHPHAHVRNHPLNRAYPVHSYIMRSRWSNFFSVHPIQSMINNTIVVNISNSILWEILTYVYSGRLNLAQPVLEDVQYMTELFQVMDRYKMHHLYKIFAFDESRQVRRSIKDLRTNVEHISADGICEPPLVGRPFTWIVDPGTRHQITFQIKFFLNDVPPWTSYSLQSNSSFALFVYVKLELETRHREDRSRFYTVHGRDYTINTTEPVQSGSRRFEGNPRPIAEFLEGIRRRRVGDKKHRKTEHFLRVTLYTSDESTGVMIETEGHGRLRDPMESYKVLGDHLHEVMTTPVEPDFTLFCDVGRPNPTPFRLHKGIFATRVPFWRAVLDNAPEQNVIPDGVTCSIESEAFHIIHTFIYSGRILAIPADYLAEIEDFVMRGGLKFLRNLLHDRHLASRSL